MWRSFFLLTPLCLVACANVPELDERITDEARNAPRPVIEPLEPVIATVADADLTAASEAALIARAARLQARADEIRRGQ